MDMMSESRTKPSGFPAAESCIARCVMAIRLRTLSQACALRFTKASLFSLDLGSSRSTVVVRRQHPSVAGEGNHLDIPRNVAERLVLLHRRSAHAGIVVDESRRIPHRRPARTPREGSSLCPSGTRPGCGSAPSSCKPDRTERRMRWHARHPRDRSRQSYPPQSASPAGTWASTHEFTHSGSRNASTFAPSKLMSTSFAKVSLDQIQLLPFVAIPRSFGCRFLQWNSNTRSGLSRFQRM